VEFSDDALAAYYTAHLSDESLEAVIKPINR
jgi:hypothetical protein